MPVRIHICVMHYHFEFTKCLVTYSAEDSASLPLAKAFVS